MNSQNNDMSVFGRENDVLHDEETISLSQIFHVFWLHRWLFYAISSFIIVLGIMAILQLIPRFTAESKLLIGIAQSNVVDVEAVLSGDMTSSSAIKDEVEVLTSRELAKKIIRKLNLLNNEEFNPTTPQTSFFDFLDPMSWLSEETQQMLGLTAPVEQLSKAESKQKLLASVTNAYLSKLKIASVRGSQVIKISFESTQPKLAAKVANMHADAYIIDQLEAKFEATRKATSWLNGQLSTLRAKVESSERAVESYRTKHKLTRGTAKVGLLREQLSEVNSQLIIAKAEKAEASARLQQVKNLMRRGSSVDTASEVLSSTLIQGLRQDEVTLTRKISEMSVEYGEMHPKMIRVRAERKELKQKIAAEIRKIAAALENELNVASSRERSLSNSLKGMSKKTGSNNKAKVRLRALEREASANKMLFESFLNRFKETSSTQGMEEADARIISKAEVPLSASYPKKKLMVAVIAILAFFIASAAIFILEMLNPGLRTPEEVETALGLPTLGLMPIVTGRKVNPINYILDKPHSQLAEAINTLRVSLSLSDIDHPVKTVMITSALPSEGKSTLTLSLARSAAQSGQRVLVIDTDLRRASFHHKLGLKKNDSQLGLVDLLRSKEDLLAPFMFQDTRTPLMIMEKGQGQFINATDILTSTRMKKLISLFKEKFDLIVFDSPPVMAVADARSLAPLVDKTVFVVHWDKTPKKVIKAGLQQMMSASPNLAGIVLQQVNLNRYGNRYSNSGYYYGKYGQYYTD